MRVLREKGFNCEVKSDKYLTKVEAFTRQKNQFKQYSPYLTAVLFKVAQILFTVY